MGMVAPHVTALWLEVNFWELVKTSESGSDAVMGSAGLGFAAFLDHHLFQMVYRSAARRANNRKFLRAFRKATRLDAVAAASEQFRAAPLVGVFDFGYSEVCRQMAARSKITNQVALERTLQLGHQRRDLAAGAQHELAGDHRLREPVHRPVRHGIGHHRRFRTWVPGHTSMRGGGAGHREGADRDRHGPVRRHPRRHFLQVLRELGFKEIGARMEDFSLEFLNLTERNFEE